MLYWSAYIAHEFDFATFPAGSVVLDVGCGEGEQLRQLENRGAHAVGVDIDRGVLRDSRAAGFDVVNAAAEALPMPAAAFDGLISKVALPYTDERRAIAEWARVLRPGATARVSGQGLGYFARYILRPDSAPLVFYAIRALANTWWYRLSGRRIPGFLGDTIYQSRRRLARYYRHYGFEVIVQYEARKFLGLDVFLHQVLRKR